jgi:hypothetical protein
MSAPDSTLRLPLLDANFPLPTDAPFTMRQAFDAGLTRHRLRMLEKHGLIRRIIKGGYVAAQVPDSRALRARTLLLITARYCVITDWTACWLWTGILSPNGHLDDPAPSMFRVAGHDRLRNGICRSGQRSFRPEDLVVVDGLTITTPIRTAWDLGRLAHRDQAIGAIDALLRLGDFSKAEFVGGVERFKGSGASYSSGSWPPRGILARSRRRSRRSDCAGWTCRTYPHRRHRCP